MLKARLNMIKTQLAAEVLCDVGCEIIFCSQIQSKGRPSEIVFLRTLQFK